MNKPHFRLVKEGDEIKFDISPWAEWKVWIKSLFEKEQKVNHDTSGYTVRYRDGKYAGFHNGTREDHDRWESSTTVTSTYVPSRELERLNERLSRTDIDEEIRRVNRTIERIQRDSDELQRRLKEKQNARKRKYFGD